MATHSTIVLGKKDSITAAAKNLRIVVTQVKDGVTVEYYDDDNHGGLPFREDKVSFDANANKRDAIKKELAHYVSNDEDEFDKVIDALEKAYEERPNDMLEYVDEIIVWEKVVGKFTVKDFCRTIGLD